MNKNVLLSIAIISIALLTGCRKVEKKPFENPLSVYQEEISNYFDASLGKHSKMPSGNQSVYVDFSDGLVQAYTSETNKKVVDYISQKMVGSSINWYGLGKNHDGVGRLEYTNDRDIYNKVISQTSYSDIMAPIEDALKKIAVSTNDALLITDFEEYSPDGREQQFGYARDYFTKWIEAGNTITFYYSTYTEKNSKSNLSGQKNLYFVLFNYGTVNENSLITKFEKAIEGRNLAGLKKFEINPNPYSVKNDYGGKEKTGLALDPDAPNQSALEIGNKEGAVLFYQNGFLNKSKPFEAFEFGQSLNDLYEFYFKEKRRFSKKLFLDATNNASYILKNIKVQVSDVTNDYECFVRSNEAKKNIPVLENDEGNNKVWTKADANNPVITECYEKNSKTLKKEFIYHYNAGEVITEIFDFEPSIFADRLKNSPKEVELITTFHKNFAGKFSNKEQVILRIDYVVDATEENYNTQLNDFKWNSIINATNGANESLYESIRNTLQAVKPKGILYSFYLKIEPSK
ncbi:MAG: hypothetical protein K9G42_01200 [Pedobacter sp.]|nr:hypothetical protein [Pedobacter sp.]